MYLTKLKFFISPQYTSNLMSLIIFHQSGHTHTPVTRLRWSNPAKMQSSINPLSHNTCLILLPLTPAWGSTSVILTENTHSRVSQCYFSKHRVTLTNIVLLSPTSDNSIGISSFTLMPSPITSNILYLHQDLPISSSKLYLLLHSRHSSSASFFHQQNLQGPYRKHH